MTQFPKAVTIQNMAASRSDSSGFAHLTQEISARRRDEFVRKLKDPGQYGHSILMEFAQAGRFTEKVTFKDPEIFIDSETKAPSYQMQCVIDGFVFPSGTVQKRKQDAKHAAARKALEILMGVSTLENDSAGDQSNQTAAVTVPQEPHSREQSPSNNHVVGRMQSLELQPYESKEPYPRTGSREEDISFENLSGPVPERYKRKLVEKHETLMEELQLKYLLPALYSKEVIQRAQYEEWSTDMEGGRTQKALREFLMDLPKVGNRSFHIALDLLKEQQRWIYDTLVIESGNAAPLSVQESEDQTVPKTFQLTRAVSDPETPIQRSLAGPPSSAKPSSDDRIVSIEVVQTSTSQRAVTEYSRTMSSSPMVGIDIVNSSSSSSGVSSSTPSSGYLSGRPLGRTPSGSPRSLVRLQSVVDILTKEDLETLKESLNDSKKPPISVLKELEDKGKIKVEYDDVNGICCCTVNGLPYEAPPTANKKEAKQLAAKCAVERILENAQVAEIAKYLSGQERLIEEFHRELKEKPPVKILEEYCKAARFPEPKDEVVEPGRQSSGGPFTFECLLNNICLGTGTRASKKDAKHAAARNAFCKILRAGGYETDVNLVSSDALPDDPPSCGHQLGITAAAVVTPPSGHSTFGAPSVAPPCGGVSPSVIPPSSYSASSHPSMELSVSSPATGNVLGNATFPPKTNQGAPNINYYKMTSIPKGLMLIINNITFSHPRHKERKGSMVDEGNLIRTFHSLGFQVFVHRNLTSQQIKAVVENFAKDPRHTNTDSAILSILSHGENGKVIGSDSIAVDLDKIYEQFDADHCPALHKKPKLFPIQACRGGNWDEGVPLSTDYGGQVGPEQDSSRRINNEQTRRQWTTLMADNDKLKPRIPTLADFLVAFPTVPEYLSWRSPDTGSLFISTLCDVFNEMASHGVDVCTMLTQVNGRVSSMQEKAFDDNNKLRTASQMPEFHVRLTKTWKLVVPNQPQ